MQVMKQVTGPLFSVLNNIDSHIDFFGGKRHAGRKEEFSP